MILRRSPLAGIFLFTLILTLSFPQLNALASSDRAKAYEDDPRRIFRLYKRFVEDAAIPKKGWMGGGMDQQYWDSKLGKWAAQLGGGRRARRSVVIQVEALKAHEAGVAFYDCGPTILTTGVPAEFVTLDERQAPAPPPRPRPATPIAPPPPAAPEPQTKGPVTYGRRRKFGGRR